MENKINDIDEVVEKSTVKIIDLLKEKHYFKARDEIIKFNSVIIAEIVEEIINDLDLQRAIIVFRLLPKSISTDVFSYLPASDQVDIVSGITDKEVIYIINNLDFDDKIDIIDELPANVVDKILEASSKEERQLINTYLNYPEMSAGSLMTPDYISLQKEMTVDEALEYIKKVGMDAETIYTCYVKDVGRKLLGIVSLSTLVTCNGDEKIKDLMVTDYIWVNVYEDQEEVSEEFKKYGFLAIPVVDSEHRLVGIITVDDILDVIEEEVTEDMKRMSGIMEFENSGKEYLETSVWTHTINRLPWLVVLMLSYIITGSIITSFEDMLAKVISLVAYMPMLMGTGGNTGSQAATLIIRGLATGEIETSDAKEILWKEIKVATIIGAILSVLNFGRIYFIDGNGPWIAFTVCSAMLLIVIIAKILGAMIPILAKMAKIDPALVANPAISSISDMVSCITYLLMAKVVLGI